MADPFVSPPAPRDHPPTALPSVAARVVAFCAILIGGVCGGLIGAAFADLQCTGDCSAPTAIGALVGAVAAAAGVGVIAVLALRAMAEWDRSETRGPGATRR